MKNVFHICHEFWVVSINFEINAKQIRVWLRIKTVPIYTGIIKTYSTFKHTCTRLLMIFKISGMYNYVNVHWTYTYYRTWKWEKHRHQTRRFLSSQHNAWNTYKITSIFLLENEYCRDSLTSRGRRRLRPLPTCIVIAWTACSVDGQMHGDAKTRL